MHVWNLQTARGTETVAHNSASGVVQVQALNDHDLVTQGRDGLVILWSLREDGVLQSTGSIPGSGYHFCKCRAIQTRGNGGNLPNQSLITYAPEQWCFQVWDLRSRRHCSSVAHENKFGLCMSVRADETQYPLLVAGCVSFLPGRCVSLQLSSVSSTTLAMVLSLSLIHISEPTRPY